MQSVSDSGQFVALLIIHGNRIIAVLDLKLNTDLDLVVEKHLRDGFVAIRLLPATRVGTG